MLVCLNCTSPLHGRYCSGCGQDAQLPPVTVRGLVHDFFLAYVAYDNLVWRSLALLIFKPGQLMIEFLAGRRARYLHPRRIYLFTSIVYFLCFGGLHMDGGPLTLQCAALAGRHFGPDDIDLQLTSSLPDSSLRTRMMAAISAKLERLKLITPQAACERFLDNFSARIPIIAFLLLPFFALILKIFFWRRNYVEHLLFSVYEHALVFTFFFISGVLALFHWEIASAFVSSVLIPLHIFLALHRVYGKTWWDTAWRFAIAGFAYMFVFTFILTGVGLYAAWHTV